MRVYESYQVKYLVVKNSQVLYSGRHEHIARKLVRENAPANLVRKFINIKKED